MNIPTPRGFHHFLRWLGERLFRQPEPEAPAAPAVRVRPPSERARKQPAKPELVTVNTTLGGRIVDGGPGKNVLVRNRFVREETGTHDTLKILDESVLETADEEGGIDPYNTGRFDRAKSWETRFRK